MADTLEIQPLSAPAGAPDSAGEPEPGTPLFSLLMLGGVAAVAWLIGAVLPAQAPIARTDTLESWMAFGLRIVRDLLHALTFLCLALIFALLWPAAGRWFERLIFHRRLRVFLGSCAAIAVLSSAAFNYFIFDHMPHIQDEIAMEFQSKILAGGRLTAPAPRLPEFFDCEFIINNTDTGRWYGKYFIGQALFLVPGEWMGSPWLVHPLLGGLAVWLTYLLGVELWSERLGRLGALLMTLSPFRMVIFAMMLGHASSLIVLGVFALAMLRLVQNPRRWGWAFVGGLAIGLACNARPLTAVSVGGAISLITALAFPWRQLAWRSVVAFSVGLGLFVAVFFGYNKALTGKATLTPFNQWSRNDRLGFGPEVGLEYWREKDKGHTLRKGVFKDVYFNLDALRVNGMGWGGIVFLLAVVPLLIRRYRKLALGLWVAPAAVAAAHVFHVSHGVLAGQARYWSESMPMMILLVGLGLLALRSELPHITRWLGAAVSGQAGRTTFWIWMLLMTLWSVNTSHARLISECIGEFWGQGPGVRDQARSQSIDRALVFMKSGSYRSHWRGGIVDLYPCGFRLNDPDLSGPIVYARDLGPEKNAQLIAQYADRTVYRVAPAAGERIRFIPYGLWSTSAPEEEEESGASGESQAVTR